MHQGMLGKTMAENFPGNVGVKGQGGHALDPLLNWQWPHNSYQWTIAATPKPTEHFTSLFNMCSYL